MANISSSKIAEEISESETKMQEVVEINIDHLNSKSEEVNPNAMEVDEIAKMEIE